MYTTWYWITSELQGYFAHWTFELIFLNGAHNFCWQVCLGTYHVWEKPLEQATICDIFFSDNQVMTLPVFRRFEFKENAGSMLSRPLTAQNIAGSVASKRNSPVQWIKND